jgi:hypothetical protein
VPRPGGAPPWEGIPLSQRAQRTSVVWLITFFKSSALARLSIGTRVIPGMWHINAINCNSVSVFAS